MNDDETPSPDGRDKVPDGALAHRLTEVVNGVISNGVGPLTGSADYARSRLRTAQGSKFENEAGYLEFKPGSVAAEQAISRIIKESVAAAGTAGFITGLGGFVTMVVALPANIAGAMIINARMVGAIAYLRGYELTDPTPRRWSCSP